jgi:hypothetical protein
MSVSPAKVFLIGSHDRRSLQCVVSRFFSFVWLWLPELCLATVQEPHTCGYCDSAWFSWLPFALFPKEEIGKVVFFTSLLDLLINTVKLSIEYY